MDLFIYFNKDFSYVKSGEGFYINQIELGMHCIVVSNIEGLQPDCTWFNFLNRSMPIEQHELSAMWDRVIRGMDNMPPKVKTFFLLGGLEIAKQDLPK